MNKGIVMDMTDRFAVVMTRDGRFVKVKVNPAYQIGEEISIAQKTRLIDKKWLISAVAAILLCVIALSALSGSLRFSGKTITAVAYVSIDINPSIELGLDRRSIVVEASGLNEVGKQVLQNMTVIGRDVEEVTADLIRQAGPYIDQYLSHGHGDIFITSTILSEEAEIDQELLTQKLLAIIDTTITELTPEEPEQVTEKIEVNMQERVDQSDAQQVESFKEPPKQEVKGQKSVRVTAITVPKDVRNDAKEKGISAGKLAFGLIIAQKSGHTLSLDEVEGMSITQLAEKIGGLDHVIRDQERLASEIEQLFQQSRKGKSDIALENIADRQHRREPSTDRRSIERWNHRHDGPRSDNDRGNRGNGHMGKNYDGDANDDRGTADRRNHGNARQGIWDWLNQRQGNHNLLPFDWDRNRKNQKENSEDDNKRGHNGRGVDREDDRRGHNGRGVDREDDKRGNIGRGADREDDRRGNIGRGADREDDRRGNIGRGADREDDRRGHNGRGVDREDDRRGNIGRGADREDDRRGNNGRGVDREDDRRGNIGRGADREDDKRGDIGRGADREDDKRGHNGRGADREDDRRGHNGRGVDREDDKRGNIGRDADREDDKRGNIGRGADREDDKRGHGERHNDAGSHHHTREETGVGWWHR